MKTSSDSTSKHLRKPNRGLGSGGDMGIRIFGVSVVGNNLGLVLKPMFTKARCNTRLMHAFSKFGIIQGSVNNIMNSKRQFSTIQCINSMWQRCLNDITIVTVIPVGLIPLVQ